MDKNYFPYDPSLVAASIFCALFALGAIGHLAKLIRYKQKFVICLFVGIIMEIVGFAVRIISIKQPSSLILYAIQSFFILVAPVIFAASIYVTLSRILRTTKTEDCSFLRPKWITRVFVTGGVLSLLLQGAGGGIQAGAKSDSSSNLGSNLAIVGLVIQIVFFSIFVILSFTCHVRTARYYQTVQPKCPMMFGMQPALYYILYISSLLILIRSVYRVVEYGQGYNGYLMTHEVYIYCLDALLMFLLTVITYFYNPGEAMQKYIEDSNEQGYVLNKSRSTNVHDDDVAVRGRF